MRSYGYFCSRAMWLLLCGLLLTLGRAVEAQSYTFTTNTTITASTTTYENDDIIVSGCTVTIDGSHSFHSLTIQNNGSNNGVVTHDPQSSANFAGGMNLNIATNCTITIGGSINVVGMGWAGGSGSSPALGPGAGGSDASGGNGGGGGAYGGEALAGSGAAASGGVYDDLTLKAPTDLGSGGGSGHKGLYAGGSGGGAIRMTVDGTLQVDGSIIADGQSVNPYGGGGSGGSIYLIVGTLSGAGFISASGGNAYNQGGSAGGGRIAIQYATNSFATPLTAAGYQIRAAGGYSDWYNSYAGAGTVFLKQVGQTQGDLWVHNQGFQERASAYTPLKDSLTFDDVYVWGQGYLTSQPSNPLMLTVLSNVTVAVDGQISVTGRGYLGGFGSSPARGPGAGGSDTSGTGGGGGGAYGGEAHGGTLGGNPVVAAGAVYDDFALKAPTDLGSGGGSGQAGQYAGGNGGGAIQMTVDGTLQVDGQVSADGQGINYYGGGGSGGSIYLTVGTLSASSGSGFISASGGSTYNSGGAGGGGRIAIYYTTNNFATPLTTSGYQIHAAGGQDGGGQNFVGSGTVFLQQIGQMYGDLWVHNQGGSENLNAYTPLEDTLTFDDIYIWGEGVLASPVGAPLTLQVLGTLDVGVNGYLYAAGRGYVGGSSNRRAGGPGAGMSDLTGIASGGGGGYGGAGGASNDNGINPGGSTYGSAAMPTNLGSGGGSGYQGIYSGGNGGGAIHATVNGTLQVDGAIIADGQSVNPYGGGGSGGSLWLVANALSGIGSISASGGNANDGGGGGGGRIALYASANNLSGMIVATGGSGSGGGAGAAGTVNIYPTSGVSLQALSLAATTVPEGQSTIGSVTLSGPAPTGGITIALTPSNSTVATVQPSVTVLAGQQGATFPITANASGTAGSVTISATLGGVVQTVTLNVLPWIASVSLNPSAVPASTATVTSTSTGTVTLNFPAPHGGLPVTLVSGNTNAATVTGSVNVPQGKTSATFSITTSSSVVSETPVAISATYGPESSSATLYIDPSTVALKAFTLTPTTVVGGNVSIGTVSITGKAPAGGAVIALSSTNTALASVLTTVTVLQGKSSVAFVISTPQVTTSQSANITATLGAVTKTASLKVHPVGVGTLTLVPNSVQGGVETAIGIVTLQSAAQTSTTVTITSNSTYAIPDPTIVIPTGALTGFFNINTLTNSTGKPIKATITATANGISAKATLTVTP